MLSQPHKSPFRSQPGPPQPVPQQTVIVQQPATPPPSQALPALASFFITGLGQLIQGRVGAALFWFCAAVVCTLLCFVLIGFLLLPLVWILCIVDAAIYNPVAFKPRTGFSLLRVAVGVVVGLAAFIVLASFFNRSESGRPVGRQPKPRQARPEPTPKVGATESPARSSADSSSEELKTAEFELPASKPTDSKPPVPKTRIWTDNTGKYQVEAAFVSMTAVSVKLRKTNGRTINLPMERLRKEDQEWIRKRGR